jgi:hypothetical protein
MINLPPQVYESFVPITAGIIVSLINKYIINGACCEPTPPEEIDFESESDDTIKTEMTDSVSRTSAITTASLPVHPVHTIPHHVYYYTH